MKAPLLVTGSLAFDRISVFKDRFSKHILKGHVHNLNVSFTVEDMRVSHGGTGGNIAYNLAQMGENPMLMGALGFDGGDYLKAMKKQGVDVSQSKIFPKYHTASATIMTDLDDNQITSFYAGAMVQSATLKISQLKAKPSLAIIAPSDIQAMQDYADYCFEKGIPFIADPGQAIPAFTKTQLREFLMGAHALVVNDYEWELLTEKTGWSLSEILENLNFLIITFGDKGSKVFFRGEGEIKVPAYKSKKVVDPTGCGDAYRAGLMYGYQHGFDIEKSARIASYIASKVVEVQGTQNHKLSKSDLKKFLRSIQN